MGALRRDVRLNFFTSSIFYGSLLSKEAHHETSAAGLGIPNSVMFSLLAPNIFPSSIYMVALHEASAAGLGIPKGVMFAE